MRRYYPWHKNPGAVGRPFIGASGYSLTSSAYAQGNIDELILEIGVCRYTSDFTPRTSPYS